jgi:hypothetical protein
MKLSKFSSFIAIWVLALVAMGVALFGYDSFARWRAEDARIDQWVAEQAKKPKGDEQIASLEAFRGYCNTNGFPQLDKFLDRYAHVRGDAYQRVKSKTQLDFATNPFTGVFLKSVCPMMQQAVDDIAKRWART